MKRIKWFTSLMTLGLMMTGCATSPGNQSHTTTSQAIQIKEQQTSEQEETPLDNLQQNTLEEAVDEAHLAKVRQEKISAAEESFRESGLVDLYGPMKAREKKKWAQLLSTNDYFGTEASLEISSLYEIAPNQYYVLGYSSEEEVFELVLMQEEENYFVTKASYPSEQILTSEALALYKKAEQQESNVAIEYNKVRKLDGLEAYVGYLDQAIQKLNEEVINDNGKSEVTQYVQYAIEDLSSTSTVAEDNVIQIKQELIEQMKQGLTTAKDQFNELLDENDISFNKSLNEILKLQIKQASFKKPIYIQLPTEVEDLGEITGLRILLDESSYVYIEGKDLQALAGLKIKIERLKDKATYEITFLNEQDEVMEQLEQTLTFAFPAKDEFTTVVATYDGEEQNWGGQYEAATRLISFGTKYSGQYKIVDNLVKIEDISELNSSQQAAIKFMVSKGYLSLENDCFNPNEAFTRYQFAEALVKMFFALDKSLETDFKDVPVDSPYYGYVASGQTYDIIKGYVDGTFKGEVNIPTEQVISLCARTIADKKGYIYPEQLEAYLQFADANEIAKWATQDIALAVQSGLITGGGNLVPKAEITKAESAEVLYNLFMLLYETSPDNVVEMTIPQKTYSILGVLLVALLLIGMIRRFIKRNKVIITMLICTAAIIATLIIGFKGGF